MPERNVLFGVGLGEWNAADAAAAAESARLATQAARDGLDLFTVADHPYLGAKLDAYALASFLLGRTEASDWLSQLYRKSWPASRHALAAPPAENLGSFVSFGRYSNQN